MLNSRRSHLHGGFVVLFEEIEQVAVPALRAGLEALSRNWPDFYWTLQVRGNDVISSWTLSGFRYACPIDDDEVSASLTLESGDSGPHLAVDVWMGTAAVGQSQGLMPKEISELRPFLEQSTQSMLGELDVAAGRLLKMIDRAEGQVK
jgi:hypothetical protein